MDRLLSGKLTRKGQLTIPIELRSALHIEEGDRLEFVFDGSVIQSITPVKKKGLIDFVGYFKSEISLTEEEISHESIWLEHVNEKFKEK